MTTTEHIEARDVEVGDRLMERASYFHPDDKVMTVQTVERISEFIDTENRTAEYVRFTFGPGTWLVTDPAETVEVVR